MNHEPNCESHDVRVGHPVTIVLLDPTSHDGELALELLTAADDHVSVVVLLSGRASSAMREYALAERLTIAEAGWIYLDQVATRITGNNRAVGTVLATGPDPVDELVWVASSSEVTVSRILLPPSVLRHDAFAIARLCDHLPAAIPVAVANMATAGR